MTETSEKKVNDKRKQVNMELLTNHCEKISIEDEDEDESGLVLEQGENEVEVEQEKLKWRLVGRFLTDRVIHSHVMKSVLGQDWCSFLQRFQSLLLPIFSSDLRGIGCAM